MRFAYADPPYIGQAKKHYSDDPLCAEVDHAALVDHLITDYPDGWALSLSSPTLKTILPLCPDTVRVCAWVKPFCAFKANVTLAYAWEPVILYGGRPRSRQQPTVRDWLSCGITLKKGLVGAKPEQFAYWLFEMWNVQDGDAFVDLFPGTGVMSRAWHQFSNRLPLGEETA